MVRDRVKCFVSSKKDEDCFLRSNEENQELTNYRILDDLKDHIKYGVRSVSKLLSPTCLYLFDY